jgi:hypothetical protein
MPHPISLIIFNIINFLISRERLWRVASEIAMAGNRGIRAKKSQSALHSPHPGIFPSCLLRKGEAVVIYLPAYLRLPIHSPSRRYLSASINQEQRPQHDKWAFLCGGVRNKMQELRDLFMRLASIITKLGRFYVGLSQLSRMRRPTTC